MTLIPPYSPLVGWLPVPGQAWPHFNLAWPGIGSQPTKRNRDPFFQKTFQGRFPQHNPPNENLKSNFCGVFRPESNGIGPGTPIIKHIFQFLRKLLLNGPGPILPGCDWAGILLGLAALHLAVQMKYLHPTTYIHKYQTGF